MQRELGNGAWALNLRTRKKEKRDGEKWEEKQIRMLFWFIFSDWLCQQQKPTKY